MTVTVNHEQFQLIEGLFRLPGMMMGGRNPLEQPAAELVSEIARTGWVLPGIDVVIGTHGSGSVVIREVNSVSFDTNEGTMRLIFGNRMHDGTYGLTSVDVDGITKYSCYDDGSGSRTEAATAWISDRLEEAVARLKEIASAPGHDDVTEEGDLNIRTLCRVDPMLAPEDFPALYSWAERDVAYRLAGYGEAAPKNDYGLSGNGWRLTSLGANDGRPVNPKVYNGYTYASTDPSSKSGHVVYGFREDALPVEIRLKYLNEVFVVDNAAFRKAAAADRQKALAEGRDRMTEVQLNSWTLATARTLVPWSEYDGSFEEPVIVIGRQTFSDEVRLMRGPISVIANDNRVAVEMKDTLSDQVVTLYSGNLKLPHCRWATRIATEAADLLQVSSEVSQEITDILENSPQPSVDSLLAKP